MTSPSSRGGLAALAVEYSDVEEIRGPLIVVRGVSGVGWDESAVLRIAGEGSGERHGVVLEVDHDLAVVQVLEGTERLVPRDADAPACPDCGGGTRKIPAGPSLRRGAQAPASRTGRSPTRFSASSNLLL